MIDGGKIRPIEQGSFNGFRFPSVPVNDFLSVSLRVAVLQHDHIAIVVVCIPISQVLLSCIPRPDVDKPNNLVSCFVILRAFANPRAILGFQKH